MQRTYTKPADSEKRRPKTAGEVIIENLKKDGNVIGIVVDGEKWSVEKLCRHEECQYCENCPMHLALQLQEVGAFYGQCEFMVCLKIEGCPLAFDSLKGYRKVNWRECLIEKHPDFDRDPDIAMGIFCELTKNSLYFDHYVWRLFNRKPPYDDLMNKVDAYFKQLTGDNSVGFSLSSTSMLYFNEKAKWYIDQYRGFM